MTAERIMELFKKEPAIQGLELGKFKKGYQLFRRYFGGYDSDSSLVRTEDGLFDILLEKTKNYYEDKFRDPQTQEISEENRCRIDEILFRYEELYHPYK